MNTSQEQLLKLANEMLPHLDGRWSAKLDDRYSDPTVEFESIDDTRWSITLRSGGYRNEGRLRVNASLGYLNDHLRRDEPRPEITVSASRKPHELARDINRRMIAYLKPLTEVADVRWLEESRAKAVLEARCRTLTDVSGGLLVERNGDGSAYLRKMHCPSVAYGTADVDAEVFADSIRLILDRLPLELAEQVVKLVATQMYTICMAKP